MPLTLNYFLLPSYIKALRKEEVHMRIWRILALGIVLVLASCGGETDEQEAQTGEMEDAEPLEEGDKGQADSDVPSAQSGEASDVLGNGEATAFAFSEAGEWHVFCELHPSMEMTVIVEEGAETSGEASLSMEDMAFSEQSITVAPGTVVTWTNEDTADHNVAFK